MLQCLAVNPFDLFAVNHYGTAHIVFLSLIDVAAVENDHRQNKRGNNCLDDHRDPPETKRHIQGLLQGSGKSGRAGWK